MNLSPQAPGQHAGVVRRGFGYLIDCTIAFSFIAATQLWILTPLREALGVNTDWFISGLNTQLYTLATISLPIWLYFAWFEQSRWQATPGKRLCGLRVVSTIHQQPIGFGKALLRTLIKLLPWELAHLTNNLPTPVWYAENPEFRLGFVAVGLLMGVYITLVAFTKQKQGPHDLIARTLVVQHTIIRDT